MAEVKWIKLTVDMFDDEKIKIIQSMPEGDALLVVWIKLLTLAGKTNDGGYIYISEGMPYTDEMLSVIINKPLNIIRLALDTFAKLGMIENDIKGIYLLNFEKHQSLDKLAEIREQTRRRVAKHRANQKELLIGKEETCVYCGEKGDTVDHVVPKTKGGLDIKENTVCCCMNCNQQKNNYDVVKFLNDRLIMKEKVDIERIINNDVLKNFVKFDYKANRFVTVNALHVTLRNATDIDIDKNKNKNKEIKHKYGEYKNVFFTDEQYEKLKIEFPNDYNTRIEKLDMYIQSTGKKYKDCLATIRNWARNEKKGNMRNESIKKSDGSEFAEFI